MQIVCANSRQCHARATCLVLGYHVAQKSRRIVHHSRCLRIHVQQREMTPFFIHDHVFIARDEPDRHLSNRRRAEIRFDRLNYQFYSILPLHFSIFSLAVFFHVCSANINSVQWGRLIRFEMVGMRVASQTKYESIKLLWLWACHIKFIMCSLSLCVYCSREIVGGSERKRGFHTSKLCAWKTFMLHTQHIHQIKTLYSARLRANFDGTGIEIARP